MPSRRRRVRGWESFSGGRRDTRTQPQGADTCHGLRRLRVAGSPAARRPGHYDNLDRNDPHVRIAAAPEQNGSLSRRQLEDAVHGYRLRTARRRKSDQEAIDVFLAAQREASRCRACGTRGTVLASSAALTYASHAGPAANP